MFNKIIDMVFGLIIVGALGAVGIGYFLGVNVTEWPEALQLIWAVIPIFAVVGMAYLVVKASGVGQGK